MNYHKEYDRFVENQGYRKLDDYSIAAHDASNRKSLSQRLWAIALCALTALLTISGVGLAFRFYNLSEYVPRTRVPCLESDRALVCYYNMRGKDASTADLLPGELPASLCTHLNVAFAAIHNKSLYLEPLQQDNLREVVKLKQVNPNLKVLLSVGGAGENNGFSDMVVDHASRKVFIKSIKMVLNEYHLDGIDLDWEFPVLHYQKRHGARERQHFSQLLREIRMEFIREKRNYILTVALAAPQTIVDVAYDVDQINLYVDFANIMTYDFHYYTKYTPFTGINSPLYPRSSDELFLATLNVNYTVHMYLSKGLDRNKIVVGIPMYGHTFRLVNSENAAVGSPAGGVGALGGGGFVDYPAVCAFERAHCGEVALNWDTAARAPFLSHGYEWVSYESERSAREKAAFVVAERLRGAMLYSLNADDHGGRCAGSSAELEVNASFPLTRSVAATLLDCGSTELSL